MNEEEIEDLNQERLRENLMPNGCQTNIDVLHMDKGKLVTIGNYADPKKRGKRKDLTCLDARYADYPFASTRVRVSNDNNDIGMFTVNNDTQKVKLGTHARNILLLVSLPFRRGGQIDVTFEDGGSCQFIRENESDYQIKRPARDKKKVRNKYGSYHEIVCQGREHEDDVVPTLDKQKLIKQATQRKGHSILREFADAKKFPKNNRQEIEFGNDGGNMKLTPFYFTEQWAFIRTSKQLEVKDQFPRPTPPTSGLTSLARRAYREINFLSGDDEFTERSTLMDVSGDVEVNGKGVERDPNTYFLTKAFIDPEAIESVTMNAPRYFKAKSVDVQIRPNVSCEIRTNFKRARSNERVLFCTKLNGGSLDDKVDTIRNRYAS